MLAGEGTPDEVVTARGLAIVSDEGALTAAVDEAIAAHPDVAQKVRDGKVAAAQALVGAVMKATRGQADAARARELILARDQTTIGRAENCDVGLFGDPGVDRLHARIFRQGNEFFIDDAGSSTGTSVSSPCTRSPAMT